MTTQVALLNGLGIAIASDSAVTSGGKVLNTSEKVFELPLPHKVAVLTSGRADFMGHPWEVVLSAWSATLDAPLGSMVLYRESLYKFMRTMLPTASALSDHERTYLIASYFGPGNVLDKVRDALSHVLVPYFQDLLEPDDMEIFMSADWEEEFRARVSLMVTDEMIRDIKVEFEKVAEERAETYREATDVSRSQARVWIDKYWNAFDAEASPTEFDLKVWPRLPGVDELVYDLHSAFLVHPDYDGESNINLFGFGANDMFPSAAGVYMHGIVNGNLIKRFEGDAPPSGEARAFFFGQSEALESLTKGNDSLLINAAVANTQKTLTDLYDRLADLSSEEVQPTREYIMQSLEKPELADELIRIGSEEREKPFKRAIGMSPILDLAEFASQLVGLQAAYAAMTQDNPSVGGFVDVASITHRRGFEWIRHKR